jgi:hypothetical protein
MTAVHGRPVHSATVHSAAPMHPASVAAPVMTHAAAASTAANMYDPTVAHLRGRIRSSENFHCVGRRRTESDQRKREQPILEVMRPSHGALPLLRPAREPAA